MTADPFVNNPPGTPAAQVAAVTHTPGATSPAEIPSAEALAGALAPVLSHLDNVINHLPTPGSGDVGKTPQVIQYGDEYRWVLEENALTGTPYTYYRMVQVCAPGQHLLEPAILKLVEDSGSYYVQLDGLIAPVVIADTTNTSVAITKVVLVNPTQGGAGSTKIYVGSAPAGADTWMFFYSVTQVGSSNDALTSRVLALETAPPLHQIQHKDAFLTISAIQGYTQGVTKTAFDALISTVNTKLPNTYEPPVPTLNQVYGDRAVVLYRCQSGRYAASSADLPSITVQGVVRKGIVLPKPIDRYLKLEALMLSDSLTYPRYAEFYPADRLRFREGSYWDNSVARYNSVAFFGGTDQYFIFTAVDGADCSIGSTVLTGKTVLQLSAENAVLLEIRGYELAEGETAYLDTGLTPVGDGDTSLFTWTLLSRGVDNCRTYQMTKTNVVINGTTYTVDAVFAHVIAHMAHVSATAIVQPASGAAAPLAEVFLANLNTIRSDCDSYANMELKVDYIKNYLVEHFS